MTATIRLGEIAHARSGDKGSHANIGIIAYTPEGYEYLLQQLTEECVADYFRPLRPTRVQRFALPGILALNFLLIDVLGGGASRSLRVDNQGKILGLAILDLPLPEPDKLGAMRRPAP